MIQNVGMYGGSFCPLHQGHVNDIIKASSMCRELFVVLSFSRLRDEVPMEYRYRWLVEVTKELSGVKVITVEDAAASKEEYGTDAWEKGRDDIIHKLGKRPDIVFCGSDYPDDDDNIYKKLYNCPVHVFDRSVVPVSSTDIRKDPFKYWEYLPEAVRPYYVKNVYVIGTESAGKSTLVKNLAGIYDTNYVEEAGRDVCERAGGEDYMITEDFFEIMIRHKASEMDRARGCNKLLFIDTDVLTTLYYTDFLLKEDQDFEKRSFINLANGISAFNKYDLVLFLEPFEFVQDGTRNEDIGANPEQYRARLCQEYDRRGIDYVTISGDYQERLESAIAAIESRWNISR